MVEGASGLFVGGGASFWWQPRMLQGHVSTGNGAHGRELGFQGGLGQVSHFLKGIWVPLSFPTSLFSLQNWRTSFAAWGLFPYCGSGDCRVVSNLEIAGIADSEQN